jgi:uncharacterized phage-like protein YoqJ
VGKLDINDGCAFTGHRANKLPWCDDETDPRCIRLKQLIFDAAEAVYHDGVRHYFCGMATGCDMYFCEAVLRLREQLQDITLEAAIPWEGQNRGWSARLRGRYDRLVALCDEQTLLSPIYTPDCMMLRNRYMVDRSRYLIAAYDGRPGGTQNTILYAMRQGLEVIQLPIE